MSKILGIKKSIFEKNPILNIWQGHKYVSGDETFQD